jgi:glycosyltransferase involved in cell wall biosynthesis
MSVRKSRLLIASQPLEAGVPSHVLDVIHGLDRDRFELVVAAPRASVLWRELFGDPGVELHAIDAAREPSPASDSRTLARLVRLAARADVIHGHSAKAGFLSRVAAATTGRTGRCLFTPHGWSFWAAQGRAARQVYLGLERAAAHWCGTIVAVGEFERDAGLAAGIGRPEQYVVVPNGIDIDRFALPRRPVPGRVLMVGRIAAPKRHDIAVDAIMRVRRRHPNAELHLVGDGPGRQELERRISDLGAQGAVRLLGSRTDVPALLAQADCVLLVSDYEGAPLSILEGMAAGVPVVASRVAGIPELVVDGESGLLVDRGSADALAVVLDRLLDDPARGAAIGEAGRARARNKYSRERMAADLTALYDAALR